jgi:predicted porin
MQKKLLTVAVAGALAMPVAAMADVTVYGTIDGGLRNQSKVNDGAGGDDSVLQQLGSYRTTNRWGLKGSEDLGGGLRANFTLEGFYTSDDNSDTLDGFNRKSIVGLSGGAWSVDVGRDYTVNFKANGIMDPMSFTYTGITTTAGPTFTAGTRDNNLITAGFRFGTGGIRVDVGLGESLGTAASGDRIGVGADFAFGPVTVAAALSTEETAVNVDTQTTNLGAAYKLGAFTIRGGINMREIDNGNEDSQWMAGLQYGFSPALNGRVGYYNWTTDNAGGTEIGSKKVLIVALDYYLSKSTTAYVEFDRQNFEGNQLGTAAGDLRDGATGIGAGIVHAF